MNRTLNPLRIDAHLAQAIPGPRRRDFVAGWFGLGGSGWVVRAGRFGLGGSGWVLASRAPKARIIPAQAIGLGSKSAK